MSLLTLGNPKTQKSREHGYLTAILHLAPASLSGKNICPWSSPGCRTSCLNTAGRGGIFKKGETTNSVQRARLERTQLFHDNRPRFVAQLVRELELFKLRAEREGLRPAVRLNGTSDIPWERFAGELFAIGAPDFANIRFYDYTKSPERMRDYLRGHFPDRYSLTFSRSETNGWEARDVLEEGGNVAVVFRDRVPEAWQGVEVVNGDAHDLRFLDPVSVPGRIIGLTAKGRARCDRSGFVVG